MKGMEAMMTIEEAIQKRLEEKRQALNEQKRLERERKTETGRLEAMGAELYRARLSDEYGIDLSALEIKATTNGNRGYFSISIDTANDGKISFGNPVALVEAEGNFSLIVHPTGNPTPFHATIPSRNGERLYVDFDNLVDALIYAIHGTSTPEIETVEYPEMVTN